MNKYNYILRLIHWTMAVMIILMLISGLLMVSELNYSRYYLMPIHTSMGMSLALLAILRLFVKAVFNKGHLLEESNFLQKILARSVHFIFYILFFLIPISGLLMSFYAQNPAYFFGVNVIPNNFSSDEFYYGLFRNAHTILAYLIGFLVFAHLSGVIFHHIIERKNILKKMSLFKR